jgi:hypothetical protein
MKKTTWLVVALAPLISASVIALADGKKTLNGEFNWIGRDVSGDLEAVFTPTGEGSWDVDFHFDFRGSPHVYSGTAEGSLSDGKLEGQVRNEDKKRSFTFTGSFDDGKFSGTHAETTAGREASTGTLTLSD